MAAMVQNGVETLRTFQPAEQRARTLQTDDSQTDLRQQIPKRDVSDFRVKKKHLSDSRHNSTCSSIDDDSLWSSNSSADSHES